MEILKHQNFWKLKLNLKEIEKVNLMNQLALQIKELPIELIIEILNNLKLKFYVLNNEDITCIKWFDTTEDAIVFFC